MAPLATNVPLSGAYRSRNRDQKHFELDNALRFDKRQDLRAGLLLSSLYYRIVSALVIFRNSTTLVISLPRENCPV